MDTVYAFAPNKWEDAAIEFHRLNVNGYHLHSTQTVEQSVSGAYTQVWIVTFWKTDELENVTIEDVKRALKELEERGNEDA